LIVSFGSFVFAMVSSVVYSFHTDSSGAKPQTKRTIKKVGR